MKLASMVLTSSSYTLWKEEEDSNHIFPHTIVQFIVNTKQGSKNFLGKQKEEEGEGEFQPHLPLYSPSSLQYTPNKEDKCLRSTT